MKQMLLVFSFFPFSVFCQIQKMDSTDVKPISFVFGQTKFQKNIPYIDEVYSSSVAPNKDTTAPIYKSGRNEMILFIHNNFVVPVEDKANNIKGRIIVTFMVDKKGNIIKPMVIQGLSEYLDKEAIRIVNLLKFKSGKIGDESVDFIYTLPIRVDYE